jgi:hypothetical protein
MTRIDHDPTGDMVPTAYRGKINKGALQSGDPSLVSILAAHVGIQPTALTFKGEDMCCNDGNCKCGGARIMPAALGGAHDVASMIRNLKRHFGVRESLDERKFHIPEDEGGEDELEKYTSGTPHHTIKTGYPEDGSYTSKLNLYHRKNRKGEVTHTYVEHEGERYQPPTIRYRGKVTPEQARDDYRKTVTSLEKESLDEAEGGKRFYFHPKGSDSNGNNGPDHTSSGWIKFKAPVKDQYDYDGGLKAAPAHVQSHIKNAIAKDPDNKEACDECGKKNCGSVSHHIGKTAGMGAGYTFLNHDDWKN